MTVRVQVFQAFACYVRVDLRSRQGAVSKQHLHYPQISAVVEIGRPVSLLDFNCDRRGTRRPAWRSVPSPVAAAGVRVGQRGLGAAG
jgi:hypothetical protein